ncbi:helix-turn-helix domain-containing protein [Jiulongibacter sp. NS-SX5]|uniref:helix-turn-helix domain-containing protein n=1 Tax=Jiulongibacter sp. NS-SX5 TaxID=3463854 RepID=UPI004058888E
MNSTVPVLTAEEMDSFHFGNDIAAMPQFTGRHLFHINRLESYVNKLTFPLPPHRKVTYDFIFLTQGSSIRSKGLSEYEIIPNQFFFLPAYQITEHKFMSPDVKGYYVHFSPDIFHDSTQLKLLQQYDFLGFLANPVVEVDEKTKERICRGLDDLLEVYESFDGDNYNLIVFKILNILSEASLFATKEVENVLNTAAALLVNQYKDALAQKIYQLQKVSEYADLLNVTPNHLNKCVKQITHKTAQELLNELIIMEAKSLLKYSDLQIAEVAVRLCNQNPSNFSRFFKSQTGLSPKAYQNS